MRPALILFYLGVFAAMLWATVTASFDRNVWVAAQEIWQDPWGRATLFDTYFAFLTVYLWIAWREGSWLARGLWLLAMLFLGSFTIAGYILWTLFHLPPEESLDGLFRRKAS